VTNGTVPAKSAPALITMRQVCAMTTLSRTMINRLRGMGKFPDQVNLADRRVAFIEAEVIEWIRVKITERRKI
jgi:prophage regulatory protein